ncbi:hypothetical protein [Streptomyces sp. NPDC004721]
MTPHLTTARACTAATPLLAASACYSATANPWLALPGLYAAAVLAWTAARSYTAHRRTLAEHHWARRQELGACPPPLDPCCLLAHHSNGAAHDHRCTQPRPDRQGADYDHGTAA